MKSLLSLIVVVHVLILPSIQVRAQNAPPPEAQIEAQAREIGRQLRCVVCQNQSIEDSQASLAEDMRRLVRARLRQGDNPQQVIDFIQSRYGNYVLLKPPFKSYSLILWIAPFILLCFIILSYRHMTRSRSGS